MSAGELHSCGLRTDGTITCWGSNAGHDGTHLGQSNAPEGTFVAVTAGAFHSCGVRTSGIVTCWGLDAYDQASPPHVYSSIDVGADHFCGVRIDAAIVCFGGKRKGTSQRS